MENTSTATTFKLNNLSGCIPGTEYQTLFPVGMTCLFDTNNDIISCEPKEVLVDTCLTWEESLPQALFLMLIVYFIVWLFKPK